MKKTITLLLFCLVAAWAQAQNNVRSEVELVTDSGVIRLALYNETPKHRDNFLKMVQSGAYNGVLFHRVIKDFMVQTGDLASKTATQGQLLGDTPESYSIPAEICFPKLYHKRGALAAAREGDDVNPERASSSTQFYIVWGQKFTDKQLEWAQSRIEKYTDGKVKLTPELCEVYKTIGGTPHLDGSYTVFGEVLEGLDVVEKIQRTTTDSHDRPVNDIRIIKATVIK
ncbi:peptidylprolyl isomerase [Prevotella aurantiaca JCM 15754]|jgi:peptidyl-prolyl cis-trans isomerase, cyclophilin-type|uniref:Peptidyl-prolyl cis-trans isomerase n=1 Tax=Prevotella aurantiaca TaxID=596085 RepID=A0A930HNQ6_9BACT|nr:peptidylprolyl isomerase [Prevotella aurantiaca]MBF1385026.1 peptidylprolyl isomerase [Prevotella aurantiaca]MBF1385383.1 peptidylprolyl isomerase [Prevotella aurantiaca]